MRAARLAAPTVLLALAGSLIATAPSTGTEPVVPLPVQTERPLAAGEGDHRVVQKPRRRPEPLQPFGGLLESSSEAANSSRPRFHAPPTIAS